MSKKEMLESVIADYKAHRDKVREIHILYRNGTKAGIGNNEVIRKVMDTLIEEAESQLLELKYGKWYGKCPNFVPKPDVKQGKNGWRKFPDEKPAAAGEYLVRGIGGLDNKLHHWVCLWVGDFDDKTIAHRFFYGGNEFRECEVFEWVDVNEL